MYSISPSVVISVSGGGYVMPLFCPTAAAAVCVIRRTNDFVSPEYQAPYLSREQVNRFHNLLPYDFAHQTDDHSSRSHFIHSFHEVIKCMLSENRAIFLLRILDRGLILRACTVVPARQQDSVCRKDTIPGTLTPLPLSVALFIGALLSGLHCICRVLQLHVN